MNATEPATTSQHQPGTGWEHAPWTTIFDLRERDSAWLDSQQIALVKAFAVKELGIEMPELDARLLQLSNLLPDIGEPPVRSDSPDLV